MKDLNRNSLVKINGGGGGDSFLQDMTYLFFSFFGSCPCDEKKTRPVWTPSGVVQVGA